MNQSHLVNLNYILQTTPRASRTPSLVLIAPRPLLRLCSILQPHSRPPKILTHRLLLVALALLLDRHDRISHEKCPEWGCEGPWDGTALEITICRADGGDVALGD